MTDKITALYCRLSHEDISKTTGVLLEIVEELAKEIKPVSA